MPTNQIPSSISLLQDTPLFADISKDILQKLTAEGHYKTWKKNSFLLQEGELVTGVFVVQTGIVKIVKFSPEGRESILRLTYPNSLLGESPIFHDGTSPVSALAVTEVVTFFIPKSAFLEQIAHHLPLALNTLRSLSLRNRMLANKLGATQLQSSAKQRLAGWLLHRASITDSSTIHTGVSQEVLARLLGLARETLNRELVDFVKSDIISMADGNITIRNITALQLLCD